MMIGQKNLLNKLNNFTLNSLPHSMLLLGEYGSEQSEICDYICDKFDLLKFDVSDTFSKNVVDEISMSMSPALYILDVSTIDEKAQNYLLKLFEEPNQYVYIMLLSENDSLVLETLVNRSYILKCDTYAKSDLLQLVSGKELEETRLTLEIAHTPGQIELCNHCDITKLFDMCNRLKESLSTMLVYEVLDYSNQINFKDNYDKIDLYLFIKALKNCLIDNLKLYNYVIDFDKHYKFMAQIGKMNGKQCYFDNLMLNLWELSK